MTGNVGALNGARSVQQLVEEVLRHALEASLAQSSSRCQDSQDGLQDLRDLIDGNLRKASLQCEQVQRTHSERSGNAPAREAVMQLLRKLMVLMVPMLEHLRKGDGLGEPTPNALRLAMCLPRR